MERCDGWGETQRCCNQLLSPVGLAIASCCRFARIARNAARRSSLSSAVFWEVAKDAGCPDDSSSEVKEENKLARWFRMASKSSVFAALVVVLGACSVTKKSASCAKGLGVPRDGGLLAEAPQKEMVLLLLLLFHLKDSAELSSSETDVMASVRKLSLVAVLVGRMLPLEGVAVVPLCEVCNSILLEDVV